METNSPWNRVAPIHLFIPTGANPVIVFLLDEHSDRCCRAGSTAASIPIEIDGMPSRRKKKKQKTKNFASGIENGLASVCTATCWAAFSIARYYQGPRTHVRTGSYFVCAFPLKSFWALCRFIRNSLFPNHPSPSLWSD